MTATDALTADLDLLLHRTRASYAAAVRMHGRAELDDAGRTANHLALAIGHLADARNAASYETHRPTGDSA